MNPRSAFRALTIFLGGILFVPVAGTASAQTLTWGTNGAGGSGQWDAGTTVDWYNGSTNVPWTNGDAAVFAGTAGTVSISGSVTASQLTFGTAGYTLTGAFLGGTSSGLIMETDQDTTFTGTIFGSAASNTPFTKSGSGALIINTFGDITFFSSVNIASGEMRYTSYQGPDFTGNYVLGNNSSAALTFSTAFSQVGSLAGGGANGGVVRPNGTTGNFTLQVSGTADASYAGTLAGNGSATLSLQKIGTAIQTLTNASPSLTGSTTVSGGTLALAGSNGALPATSGVTVNAAGTFQLDNGAAVNPARLGASTPVTLNGGTLSLLGNATQGVTQNFGALNVASGASTVSVTAAGGGTTQLATSGLVRTNAATVSFSDGGHVTLTGASNVNGILGAYATVGPNWAAVDAGGNVFAFAGYTTDTTTANTTDNLRIATAAGGTTSLAGVQTRNSLNLVSTGSATGAVDLGANGSLVLASGGLLSSGNGFFIQNGKLASGTGELIVTNQSALTISSVINSAVTKSGAGTLVLAGSNTYTGAATVNQGTVQVSADANLGTGTTVALNGGTLQTTAGFTSAKSLQGSGGTLDTGNYKVAFTGGANTGSFTKVGTGILSLTGQVGSVNVNAGTLQLTNLTGATSSFITLNNARLEAGTNGLQSVTSFGGTNAVISPGAHGQAATLPIGSLFVYGQTVVDDDLGSTGHDLLSVSSNLSLSTGTDPALLFRFNNLGGVQPGIAYPVLQLPSSQAFFFNTGGLGIDSVSAAAGYKGAFSVVGNTVDITFSAVPEPSVPVVLLCGALVVWAVRSRRRAAGAKCAN